MKHAKFGGHLMPCMGGWCGFRENCGHYHSKSRMHPPDRICPAGSHIGWVPMEEATPAPKRVKFVPRVQAPTKPATPHDLMRHRRLGRGL